MKYRIYTNVYQCSLIINDQGVIFDTIMITAGSWPHIDGSTGHISKRSLLFECLLVSYKQ